MSNLTRGRYNVILNTPGGGIRIGRGSKSESESMQSVPLVRQVAIVPAVSFLTKLGAPVRRHLARANLPTCPAEAPESLVPLHQACQFLGLAARAEGIDDLGVLVGGQLGIESLGAYGRVIAHSLTIHDGLQATFSLISAYNSGLAVWVERPGDEVRYCQRYVDGLEAGRSEAVHLGLTNTIAYCQLAGGSDWRPIRVQLATGPVDLARHCSALADVPVSFNQSCTSLTFSRSFLSQPLRRFDRAVREKPLARELDKLMNTAPATDFVGQMQQVLDEMLDRYVPSIQLAAAVTGLSVRTLQRRLREHGWTFRRLLQDVRFQGAQHLMGDPDMELTEVARRLGYSDPANFTRAFHRWCGVGPSEFRRLTALTVEE